MTGGRNSCMLGAVKFPQIACVIRLTMTGALAACSPGGPAPTTQNGPSTGAAGSIDDGTDSSVGNSGSGGANGGSGINGGTGGGVDGQAPIQPAGDGGTPGTACGMRYGTIARYATGGGKLYKVYVDGEIDEYVALLHIGLSPTKVSDFLINDKRIILISSLSWWMGALPPVDGVVELTEFAPPGIIHAGDGPMAGKDPNILAVGNNQIVSFDLDGMTSAVDATTKLPPYYRITEFLKADPAGAFSVLASPPMGVGVPNLVFDVDAQANTTTQNGSINIAQPILGAFKIDTDRTAFFDAAGFYINGGTRVRKTQICLEGKLYQFAIDAVE